MYHQLNIAPGYAGSNWVLPPIYNLTRDVGPPSNLVLGNSSMTSPVLLPVLPEAQPFTLRYSSEVVNTVKLNHQTSSKTTSQKFQQTVLPFQQNVVQFQHQFVHFPLKIRSNLHKFRKASAIRCEVCKVSLNSRLQATQHFNGKNHLRVLNKIHKLNKNHEQIKDGGSSENKLTSCSIQTSKEENLVKEIVEFCGPSMEYSESINEDDLRLKQQLTPTKPPLEDLSNTSLSQIPQQKTNEGELFHTSQSSKSSQNIYNSPISKPDSTVKESEK